MCAYVDTDIGSGTDMGTGIVTVLGCVNATSFLYWLVPLFCLSVGIVFVIGEAQSVWHSQT